ncbi:nascent polypeptide-associated complex protein [Vulcanisaeta thermophila]|uniref:nascent polypeptide-associated complex protein n=1 Tax=Vulcanisaeta thermophila TaxID=867917 RepID=UPI00085386AD|nr:nascent polypeptide-associated complex protein [Vulcanisaeta thermophila]
MGFSPREVRRLLKRLGIQDLNLEEVSNVTKVMIYLGDGSVIEINKPVVARMRMSGLTIYQVQTSDADVRVSKQAVPQTTPSMIITAAPTQSAYTPSEEDVKLVMEQTGCTREEAVKALRETNGDIAEAIMRIQQTRQRQ